MSWDIRRIVNGCARQLLVARRDVIAPEFISYGLVISPRIIMRDFNSMFAASYPAWRILCEGHS